MATRFYVHGTAAPDVSPAWASIWEETSTIRRTMATVKQASAHAEALYQDTLGTTNEDIGVVQCISAAVNAGVVLTGTTVTALFDVREGSALANGWSQMVVRVRQAAGTMVDVYTGHTSTTVTAEWANTNTVEAGTTRWFPPGTVSAPATLGTYTTLAGDRVVVELGLRSQSTRSADPWAIVLGDNQATDFTAALDATNTSDGWIEFSANLFTVAAAAAPLLVMAWPQGT